MSHGERKYEGGDVLVLFTSQRYRSTPRNFMKAHESRRKIPHPNKPPSVDMIIHSKTSRMIDMWSIEKRGERTATTCFIKWVHRPDQPTNQPVCSTATAIAQRCCKNALRLHLRWTQVNLPMMKRVREAKTASWNTIIHGWYLSSLISSSLVQASQLSCRVCRPIFLK